MLNRQGKSLERRSSLDRNSFCRVVIVYCTLNYIENEHSRGGCRCISKFMIRIRNPKKFEINTGITISIFERNFILQSIVLDFTVSLHKLCMQF